MAGNGTRTSGGSSRLREHMATIRSCERSGESLKAYAERAGISPRTLYEAKRQARKRGLLPPHRSGDGRPSIASQDGAPARFVEATPQRVLGQTAPAWRLRLPGGEVLEVATPLCIEDALRLVEGLGVKA